MLPAQVLVNFTGNDENHYSDVENMPSDYNKGELSALFEPDNIRDGKSVSNLSSWGGYPGL